MEKEQKEKQRVRLAILGKIAENTKLEIPEPLVGKQLDILIQEFASSYMGNDLLPLNLQYKDFLSWQNEMNESGEIKKSEKYWTDKFSGEIPVLNIQTDFNRPVIQSFKGSLYQLKLDSELTERLRKIAAENDMTLFMFLLGVYNITSSTPPSASTSSILRAPNPLATTYFPPGGERKKSRTRPSNTRRSNRPFPFV